MSTSSIAPQVFTGVSTYSSDFQSILSRAVNIASLPLKQLQNTESDLLQKQAQLTSFGDSVAALTSSFSGLTTSVAGSAIQASSSDSTIVSATATGATSASTYTINSVTSLATQASETSSTGYADSSATKVSSTGSLKLVIGSKSYNINLSSSQNNLVGLQNAINSLGVGVTASILTTGTGANPNFLSLSANSNGKTTLQLFDDPTGANTNIVTSTNQGTDAVFQFNGITVDRQSNSVNDLVSGLTFSLKAKSTTPVTLSLATSGSALSSALSSFVSAYNGLASQVNGQVGRSAGLLSGNQIVIQTSSALRQIAGYFSSGSSGSIQSLSDLGVSFGADGQATFDSSKISGFSDSQIASAFQFVGSATKGFGALGNTLQQISDPVNGLIKAQQDSYVKQDTGLKTQISNLQDRISNLQTSLQSRLATYDTLIAGLQSQQQIITASVNAVNLSLFGKSTAA